MIESLSGIEGGTLALLVAGLAIAFGFEFVNGFHDTANAVATVIYTRSLAPGLAVAWSGLWNALGVVHAAATGFVVAFSIVHLLPVDLLVSLGPRAGLAMVFSLLLAAVAWNLGTWFFGLPASSSHTLIGAVLGVGLAASLGSAAGAGSGVNWAKAGQVLLSLVVSPFVGFVCAGAALLAGRRLLRDPVLHRPARTDEPPPKGIRALLVLACTGVSFAHGSNDGQKGVGLVMLILIGILPANFALDLAAGPEKVAAAVQAASDLDESLAAEAGAGRGRYLPGAGEAGDDLEWKHVSLTTMPLSGEIDDLRRELASIRARLAGVDRLAAVPTGARWALRADVLRVRQALRDFDAHHAVTLPAATRARLREGEKKLLRLTEYAPVWVPIGVALALGVGTMVGWRRIVVTVGEKIGKTPMSYAQGTAAQLVTAGTILAADAAGAPVSTTHVLSSAVAGGMAASGAGLQPATLRSIALAWLLTLPASVALGAGFFLAARALVR